MARFVEGARRTCGHHPQLKVLFSSPTMEFGVDVPTSTLAVRTTLRLLYRLLWPAMWPALMAEAIVIAMIVQAGW
jgi:hypothetical protein